MKNILSLILTLAFSASAATLYPVMTDGSSRLLPGGQTNWVTANGTNTFSGTNVFPAASFFPANNIGMRLLWSSPTNIYLASLSTNQNTTNAGDFALTTYIAKFTCPRLLGSNSAIAFFCTNLRTNSNPSAASLFWYGGPSTNFIGNGGGNAASVGIASFGPSIVLQGANSFTNQVQGSGVSFPVIPYATNFVTADSTFEIYIGATAGSASGHTNFQMFGLRIYELYAP